MDSAPAALFEAFWKNLMALTFNDDLPEDSWPDGGGRWFVVFDDLVEKPTSSWWDDINTPEVETRDEIINRAFAAAVGELQGDFGSDPERWAWGDLHTLTLTNQTLGTSGIAQLESIFNRGAFRSSGGSGIVNATGWDATEAYEVRGLPSMRMIVDFSNLSGSYLIHSSGQSGHAYHRHYADMTDLWRNIQYHPMLWTQEEVEAAAEDSLRLIP
jgi:penicillin amidase